MRRSFLVIGLLVLVFGLGCLNYTTADGVDHHRAWAQEHGFPPPGGGIFLLGLISTSAGAGLAGFALGRRPSK